MSDQPATTGEAEAMPTTIPECYRYIHKLHAVLALSTELATELRRLLDAEAAKARAADRLIEAYETKCMSSDVHSPDLLAATIAYDEAKKASTR